MLLKLHIPKQYLEFEKVPFFVEWADGVEGAAVQRGHCVTVAPPGWGGRP